MSKGDAAYKVECSQSNGYGKVARIIWEWEECTERTASGFNRLSRAVEQAGTRRIILDMSKCRYLSVGGLRQLLEWHGFLAIDGIMLRVGGLSPGLRDIFKLAKLDWIVAD